MPWKKISDVDPLFFQLLLIFRKHKTHITMIRPLTISYLNVKQGRKNKKKLEEYIYVNNNNKYIFFCMWIIFQRNKKKSYLILIHLEENKIYVVSVNNCKKL